MDNERVIELGKLKPNKLNEFEMSNVDEIKASIKTLGLLTPLTVKPVGDGTYRIISGEQRFMALSSLAEEDEKWNSVPCYILEDNEISETYEKLLIETANTVSRDIDKTAKRFKLLRILKELQKEDPEQFKDPIPEFVKYAKVSDRYARIYLSVFEEDDDELNKRVADGLDIKIAANLVGKSKEEKEEFIAAYDKMKEETDEKDVKKKTLELYKEKFPPKSKEYEQYLDEVDMSEKTSVPNFQSNCNTEAVYNGYDDDDDDDFEVPSDFDPNSLALDTTGNIKPLLREANKPKAEIVMEWCERLMKKESLSDFREVDYQAFEMCRELVEKFTV